VFVPPFFFLFFFFVFLFFLAFFFFFYLEERAIGLQILVPLEVPPATASGGPSLPLAIFSGGFGLDSAKYGSYTRALATCGFVAMSYDEVGGGSGMR